MLLGVDLIDYIYFLSTGRVLRGVERGWGLSKNSCTTLSWKSSIPRTFHWENQIDFDGEYSTYRIRATIIRPIHVMLTSWWLLYQTSSFKTTWRAVTMLQRAIPRMLVSQKREITFSTVVTFPQKHNSVWEVGNFEKGKGGIILDFGPKVTKFPSFRRIAVWRHRIQKRYFKITSEVNLCLWVSDQTIVVGHKGRVALWTPMTSSGLTSGLRGRAGCPLLDRPKFSYQLFQLDCSPEDASLQLQTSIEPLGHQVSWH